PGARANSPSTFLQHLLTTCTGNRRLEAAEQHPAQPQAGACETMQMIFLGKETESGESPTLYATDQDSYIIQGYTVNDAALRATLDIPEGQTVVEVYARLFAHLAHDGVTGTVTSWLPPIVHVRENGNYLIQGVRLADET